LRAFIRALFLVMATTSVAAAGPSDSDSLYLIGEFVDPVCVYQHGMQGVAQRVCAMVDKRVEQGMAFLDIRERRLYTVISVSHWEDPKDEFLAMLGDTVAVKARVFERMGGHALAITAIYPYKAQPDPTYDWNPLRWKWEWTVLLGVGLFLAAYLLATGPYRRRLDGPERFQIGRFATFAGSMFLVLIALNGPLHDLSDQYLFSTHMVQHLILAQAFAPLFVLGIPPWLWRRLFDRGALGALWHGLARVPLGFAIYTVVFSIWHVPLLYNLMMRDHDYHVAMHLMVMASAALLWWPIVGGDAVRRPLSAPAQILYLLAIGTPMIAVAAMVTLANEVLYEWYALAPRFLGLSALDDQRLGGLLMWVPGGLFWWGIASIVYFRWSSREMRRDERPFAPRTV
jgi:putative membrane protein